MFRCHNEEGSATEDLYQLGLAGLKSGEYTSVHSAAKALSISKATLSRRHNGGHSRRTAHVNEQNLSEHEEKALQKEITCLSVAGTPPSQALIKEIAESIRMFRVASINDEFITHVQYPPLGKHWVSRFLARHSQLKAIYARRIDAARVTEASSEVITRWLDAVKNLSEEHAILPENVYNMDESGFAIGSMQAGCVVVDMTLGGTKCQAQPGRQEWVTALECICGNGTSIPPLLIFKGENLSTSWIPAELAKDWYFSCSNKGWTSNTHGLEWLRQCFEPLTREKANGAKRVLICDGHGSHVTGSFIAHCMKNNIMLLRMPPHTSHLLQPLDVGLFGPLKRYLSSALNPFVRANISRISKREWLLGYEEARKKAFSYQNILGGWRGAGLFPWNPLKVLRHLPLTPGATSSTTPMSPTMSNVFNTSLLTSSPPDAETLRSTNDALNQLIKTKSSLKSPARNYVHRLLKTTERLRASLSIKTRECEELKKTNRIRKEHKKGKRLSLKDQLVLTSAEIIDVVRAIEHEEEDRKGKKRSRKRKSPTPESETNVNDEEDIPDSPVRKRRWVIDAVIV